MASTAESMLPKAVINTTGVSGRSRRTSPTISMPDLPGIRISESTTSTSFSPRHSSALSAVAA